MGTDCIQTTVNGTSVGRQRLPERASLAVSISCACRPSCAFPRDIKRLHFLLATADMGEEAETQLDGLGATAIPLRLATMGLFSCSQAGRQHVPPERSTGIISRNTECCICIRSGKSSPSPRFDSSGCSSHRPLSRSRCPHACLLHPCFQLVSRSSETSVTSSPLTTTVYGQARGHQSTCYRMPMPGAIMSLAACARTPLPAPASAVLVPSSLGHGQRCLR
jgi:hypothetical protein